MGCNCDTHTKHICYLKKNGMTEFIATISDNPTVVCRQCGAQANSAEYLCAAHLRQDAPSVEGGHGSVSLDEVGKPHAG